VCQTIHLDSLAGLFVAHGRLALHQVELDAESLRARLGVQDTCEYPKPVEAALEAPEFRGLFSSFHRIFLLLSPGGVPGKAMGDAMSDAASIAFRVMIGSRPGAFRLTASYRRVMTAIAV
jgi:hypothetical protein